MKKQPTEKEDFTGKNWSRDFAGALLRWNRYDNHRQMPWKGEKDPYKIWLSEIILQQTRVEQGLKYYQNFIAAFPTVGALAAAPPERVFKLWEGLGYYSRCRNLITTAHYIAEELNGVFPHMYDGILALKGVGPYTAAAIGSFAYNLPYAVLDGNVFRVLSRISNNDLPIDSTEGKKAFTALAQGLLPADRPGEYNQAIMDFGATVCKPVPLCESCFFSNACLAYRAGRQLLLPVKEKQTVVRPRWLNYFVVQCADEVLVQQREEKDIWQGLYQFFELETPKALSSKKLKALFTEASGLETGTPIKEWRTKQTLSHQLIHFHFFTLRVPGKKTVAGYTWTKLNDVAQLAFPRALQGVAEELLAAKAQ